LIDFSIPLVPVMSIRYCNNYIIEIVTADSRNVFYLLVTIKCQKICYHQFIILDYIKGETEFVTWYQDLEVTVQNIDSKPSVALA
jgi:hypothetical protein